MIGNNTDECPVAEAFKVIGGKWRLQIINAIGLETKRFGELKRSVAGISEKMLIQELKNLTAQQMLIRKAYPEVPPRVEYSLTEFGREVLPIIETIRVFGTGMLEAKNKVG